MDHKMSVLWELLLNLLVFLIWNQFKDLIATLYSGADSVSISITRTLCQFSKISHVIVPIYVSQIIPYVLLYMYKYFWNFPNFFE
jgi:hypothetical protein